MRDFMLDCADSKEKVMSINKIKIDTSKLQKDRNLMENHLNIILDNVKSMYEEVKVLDGMWDGEAKESFNVQFNSDYNAANQLIKEIRNFISKMDYAEKKYVECEGKVSEIINSIKI